MSIFQNKTRSISYIETSIKNRNIRNDIKPKSTIVNGAVDWSSSDVEDEYKNLHSKIRQADTVKLEKVCCHYGIDINEYSTKINCPFTFHNDSSPSFQYYPETNTFHCWGCGSNGGSSKFISLIENISISKAADKLSHNFDVDPNNINLKSFINPKEKQDLQLYFSNVVRNFFKNHKNSEDIKFMDNITEGFDKLTQSHTIDIDGIKHIIDKLEKLIKEYE